jgi:hypothetical protein
MAETEQTRTRDAELQKEVATILSRAGRALSVKEILKHVRTNKVHGFGDLAATTRDLSVRSTLRQLKASRLVRVVQRKVGGRSVQHFISTKSPKRLKRAAGVVAMRQTEIVRDVLKALRCAGYAGKVVKNGYLDSPTYQESLGDVSIAATAADRAAIAAEIASCPPDARVAASLWSALGKRAKSVEVIASCGGPEVPAETLDKIEAYLVGMGRIFKVLKALSEG